MTLNLLFWGNESRLAQQVCARLHQQWPLRAVVLPATAAATAAVSQRLPPAQSLGELPLLTHFVETSLTTLAWAWHCPVYMLHHHRAPAVVSWLQSLQPDVVCVTCFPWRIPASLLAIPTYGFLNLHPARLPDYRGPAPLFWQLRDGVQSSGVTLHWMDERFDTGAITAQAPLILPDGISGPAADQRYGDLGARLFDQVLSELAQGNVPRQAQPPGGSYQSWPQAEDFTIHTHWSAQRAFNFMRGTAEWQQPYPLQIGDTHVMLTHALDYEPDAQQSTPFAQSGAIVTIQFQPGILRVTVAVGH